MLSLITLLGKVLVTLIQYAHDKQLMDAGAAKAALKGLKDVEEAIIRARAAGTAAVSVPTDSDPDNLDNRK